MRSKEAIGSGPRGSYRRVGARLAKIRERPHRGDVLEGMLSHLFGMAREDCPPISLPPSKDPEAQLMAIKARIDALELACAGLWDLLKESAGYTDEDIAAHIRRVDARDGCVDGRIAGATAYCPSCGKSLLTKGDRKCLWCGAEIVEVQVRSTSRSRMANLL